MIIWSSILAMTLSLVVLIATGFGWQIGTVVSGSMEPTLQTGGAAVCRPVDPKQIEPGDVIAFKSTNDPSTTITHRVIGVYGPANSPSFATRGDANNSPDENLVPAENIKGKIVFHLPYVGYLFSFARTPWGIIALIAIPLAIVIGGYTGAFRRMFSTERQEGVREVRENA